VALGVVVGSGSRDEDADVAGVSHFIEHLLFKGSDAHTALEIAQIFDRFGAELNACTTREYTEISTRVRDVHVAPAMAVIGGMVRAPCFDELEAEREVVLEEIAMYEDAPDDLVHDLIGEVVFPGQPLGRPVIGTAEVIERLSLDEVRRRHRGYYTPSNVVVAAAGNVDHDAFAELIAAELGSLGGGPRPPREAARIEAVPRPAFVEKETEQYHVCLGAPGVSRTDPRRFAMSLLDQVLGGGASSRLFQEIRERRGLAYAVYSYASQYTDTGSVGIYVGTREENLDECLAVCGRELGALAAGRFEPDELERAKDAVKGRLTLSMESSGSRMARLGKGLLTGAELLDEDELCVRVDAVTEADVAGLAEELFAADVLGAACIGPQRAVFDRALATLAGAAAA
jgi:predicted Zn-dependent peptidase